MTNIAAFSLRIATVSLVLWLGGCDDSLFFGRSESPPLQGDRVSILELGRNLSPDAAVQDLKVTLPPPFQNNDWPQAGGYSSHAMHHLALNGQTVGVLWSADAGAAANDDQRILTEPIVADGRVYLLDADAEVNAFSASDGRLLWRKDLTPDDRDDDGLFGGGLAVENGRLYVTTPFATVWALNAASGEDIWQVDAPAPIRAAPTVRDGRVFTLTIDDQLVVFAEDDGRRLWSHSGSSATASLLGGAAPAVLGNLVIAAYDSGELVALRAETGRVIWSETLGGGFARDAVSALDDIRGRPVIDRDIIFAVSHSGALAAFDAKRGERIWQQDIASIQSPWVAGDFLYVLTNEGNVICLTRLDGRIKWVQSLDRFEDLVEQEDPILWAGPILAGDRLVVTGSHGVALSLSPYTGELLGQQTLPGRSNLPPVIAGGVMYILTDTAEIMALR